MICALALALVGCVALALAESGRREPEVLLGNTIVGRGRASSTAGTALAFRYTAVKSGSARAIVVFVGRGSDAAGLHVGLYVDEHGRPGRLLAAGSSRRRGWGRWYRVSLSAGPSILRGHAYWIAVLGSGGTLRFAGHRFRVAGCLRSADRGGHGLPSIWSGRRRASACSLSAYVTGPASRAINPPTADPRRPANTRPPSINGQAVAGKTLTATTGSWSGAPGSYSYQWEDCDASGGTCTQIVGATTAARTLDGSDVGATVRVGVTADNSAGATTVVSGPTSVVTAAPAHTETWAYDDCENGGAGAKAALVRGWITYALADCGPGSDMNALAACHSDGVIHCKVIQYLDTNIVYGAACCTSEQWGDWDAVAQEDWYLHEAPPNQKTRITVPALGGGDLDNVTNPAVVAFYQSYVRHNFPDDDGLMMDDTNAGMYELLYGTNDQGASSTNEIRSDSQLQAAHVALQDALTKPDGGAYTEVTNGLSDGGNPFEEASGVGPTGNQITATAPGIITEGDPENDGSLDVWYPGLLDDMAYINNETSGFIVLLSYGAAGAPYQLQSRLVQEATVLLGTEPGRVVDWADLEVGNRDLAVWPEEGIYPTKPVQTMGTPGGAGCLTGSGTYCTSGGHNDLEVAPGVFRREFGACYDQGSFFGTCAAIVNTTASAITVSSAWLTQSYANSITPSGGDVQSGGTVDLQGAPFTAGASQVPAHSALVLTGT